MAVSTSELDGLDCNIRNLHDDIQKLRKSRQYWQAWEAEYEGFKEEIEKLGENVTSTEMQAMAGDFGGDILTPKECQAILNTDGRVARERSQVLSVLSRRIDYVQDNVKAIQKRLTSAEAELASLNNTSDVQSKEDNILQVQEITEVLDDEDNVISSTVTDAKSVAPEILDALRKSGIKGIADPERTNTSSEERESQSQSIKNVTTEAMMLGQSHSNTPEPSSLLGDTVVSHPPQPVKGTGSAEEDTSAEAQGDDASYRTAKPSTVHEDVIRSLNNDFPTDPVIPKNETPEEAALRREMLQYNMNEMGSIVATMDIDGPDPEVIDEDGDYSDNDYDEYYDDEEEDPEDEYGRTTVRVIDDDYRREMLELEARLNAKAMLNVGPHVPDHLDLKEASQGNNSDESVSLTKSKQQPAKVKKKGVRFAESLDIAEDQPASEPTAPPQPNSEHAERPVSDLVVERASPTTTKAKSPLLAPHTSKFQAMRGSPQTDEPTSRSQSIVTVKAGPLAGMQSSVLKPLGPEKSSPVQINNAGDVDWLAGKTHSNKVIERPVDQVSENNTEPDEFHPDLMRQQVAVEYHKMRNRLIQRNGGFANRDGEDPEEEDQSGKKMSRFKAARLSKITK